MAKRAKARPTGFWARSKRAKVAWAVHRTIARLAKRSETRPMAIATRSIDLELRRAFKAIGWEAWARRTFDLNDGKLTPKRRDKSGQPVIDIPELKVNLKRELTKMGRAAAEQGWARGIQGLADKPWDGKVPAQKAAEPRGIGNPVDVPYAGPGEGVFVALPDAAFNASMAETFTFVAGIGETTASRMHSLMLQTMTEAGSYSEFARKLANAFPEFSRRRAQIIAVTEYRRVASSATLQAYQEAGITGKAWHATGPEPCPICLANEAQGPIPIDASFESGDDNAPAHPECHCNFSGVLLKGK